MYILPESSELFYGVDDASRTTVETYGDFIDNVLKVEVERISLEIDEKKKEYKEMGDQIAEKVLGFTPSVMNMYNLIFAHMSTFIAFFTMGKYRIYI